MSPPSLLKLKYFHLLSKRCILYSFQAAEKIRAAEEIPLPKIQTFVPFSCTEPVNLFLTVVNCILRIKCSLNLLVSYVCFDICGGIERASLHRHYVRMQFPKKFCPLCDKQVNC